VCHISLQSGEARPSDWCTGRWCGACLHNVLQFSPAHVERCRCNVTNSRTGSAAILVLQCRLLILLLLLLLLPVAVCARSAAQP
jgi:hypothetical protein